MLELKNLKVQYLKTTSGETTAVVIPIRQWNQLEEDYQKILKHTKLKNGEECILGNNKEYATLDCFKRENV